MLRFIILIALNILMWWCIAYDYFFWNIMCEIPEYETRGRLKKFYKICVPLSLMVTIIGIAIKI